MKIEVMDGGLLTTLQDMGRIGYQKFGVLANGAMDTFSLRLANLLTGNALGEAALEMPLRGPVLRLQPGTVFAITGADMMPTMDGVPVPMFRPVCVVRDAELRFGGCRRGCRSYMAVAGGFDVPLVMGSKSTYLRAGLGGWQGRALQAGDVLPAGTMSGAARDFSRRMQSRAGEAAFMTVPWFVRGGVVLDTAPLRVTRGLQYDWFTTESCEAFCREPFQITMQSDRMGYRLLGPHLELKKPREMVSEPVAFGTVQVADGNPILLLADRQTTGGYPKIFQLAQADLPRAGQCPVGHKIRFELISLCAAEDLYRRQQEYINELAVSIRLKLCEG